MDADVMAPRASAQRRYRRRRRRHGARTTESRRIERLQHAQEVPPLFIADWLQLGRSATQQFLRLPQRTEGRVEDTASLPARLHSTCVEVERSGLYLESDLQPLCPPPRPSRDTKIESSFSLLWYGTK